MNEQQQQPKLVALVTNKIILDYIEELLTNMKVKGSESLLHGQAIMALQNAESWPSVLNSLKSQFEQEKIEMARVAKQKKEETVKPNTEKTKK